MEINSLREYLEASFAIDEYYSNHTREELLEELKNIFPLNTSLYDVKHGYLGNVVGWEINGKYKFILNLEDGERHKNVRYSLIGY